MITPLVVLAVLLVQVDSAITPQTGLSSALRAAHSGDVLELTAGVFSGSNNCGLTVASSQNNITIVGASQTGTVIDCSGLQNRFLSVHSALFTLSHVTVRSGDARTLSPPWGGALYISISASLSGTNRILLSDVVLENSIAVFGGAIGAIDPPLLQLERVQLLNNQARALAGPTRGGGVYVEWRTGSTERSTLIRDSLFTNNSAYGVADSDSAAGGGFLASVAGGAGAVSVIMNGITMTDNVARSLNPWGSLVACGGICVLNMDPATGLGVSSAALLSITDSHVVRNTADCSACFGGPASPNASNTGGVGGLCVQTVELLRSSLLDNVASCTGDCLAEGGGLFSQGQGGTPNSVIIRDALLSRNTAVCEGPSCYAQGGAALIVAVHSFVVTQTTFNDNTALCHGGIASEGGALQLQDGFPGAYSEVQFNMSDSSFSGNSAIITAPAVPYSPPLIWGAQGGAIQMFSTEEEILVAIEGVTFAFNNASSVFASGKAFGGALAAVVLSKGRIRASLDSSLLMRNTASCSPAPCFYLGSAALLTCFPSCGASELAFTGASGGSNECSLVDNGASCYNGSQHIVHAQTTSYELDVVAVDNGRHISSTGISRDSHCAIVRTCPFLESSACPASLITLGNASCDSGEPSLSPSSNTGRALLYAGGGVVGAGVLGGAFVMIRRWMKPSARASYQLMRQ